MTDRLPIARRAGTPMGPKALSITSPVDRRVHGLLDPESRVFQCGGPLTDLVYWKLRLFGLHLAVWQQLAGSTDVIEFIDHGQNHVYRTTYQAALERGQFYSNAGGPRWGIPYDAFQRFDVRGQPVPLYARQGRGESD